MTSGQTIRLPEKNNPYLKTVLELINTDQEILQLWKTANINAIDRLGFTDHGPVHVQIVANIALRLLRLLVKSKIQPSLIKDYQLSMELVELVVVLASLFHDLGMSVHRADHEEFSVVLANPILQRLLHFLPTTERTITVSETLHAIISHRRAGAPFTIEGGIVRVANALDMSSGRSRIPFEQGKVDIHSLSAFAIDKVEIKEGTLRPVQIDTWMNNSSGIFQIDQLLKEKLTGSHIEQYIQVKAYIEGETEKKLLSEYVVNE